MGLTSSRWSRALAQYQFDRNNRVVRLTDLGIQLRADMVLGYRQIQDAVARASATGLAERTVSDPRHRRKNHRRVDGLRAKVQGNAH